MSEISAKLIVVQPFKLWQGHYKKYVNSFQTQGAYEVSYETAPYLLKLLTFKNKPSNFIFFYMARLINVLFYNLYSISIKDQNSNLVFIEFEPLAFMLSRLLIRRTNVYQTIHSVERRKYKSTAKEFFSVAQRFLFKYSLKFSNFLNRFGYPTIFIVHSQHHRQQLEVYVDKTIVYVVDYPCPVPRINQNVRLELNKEYINILIFGVVREDKGIYEFLEILNRLQLEPYYKIKVVGKLEDTRIREINYSAVEFFNSYVSEEYVDTMFKETDILLLPYGDSYTGGAGPMKDAASYALPVLCSNIPIFREVLELNEFGTVIKDWNRLQFYVDSLIAEYQLYSEKALKYAKENNWLTLAQHYKHIINLH